MILAGLASPVSLVNPTLKDHMTSNLIYSTQSSNVLKSLDSKHSATDRTPYCYLIGWSDHNIWYYGRRTSKNCHPTDFWKKYFTSSKYVKEFRDTHGEPDILIIRRVFTDYRRCAAWETRVLKTLNTAARSDFLNMNNGDCNYDTTNTVSVTINGKRQRIPCNEYDPLIHEIHTKNKVTVVDILTDTIHRISCIEYNNDKNRYKPLNSLFTPIKTNDGINVSIYADDYNSNSKLYVKRSEKESWYFDELTQMPFKCLRIHPFIYDGTAIKITNDKFVYKNIVTDEYKYLSANDDIICNDYASYDIVPCDEIVSVVDSNNCITRTSIHDKRINISLFISTSREIVQPKASMKGKLPAKDVNGNTYHVKNTDIRLKTGELHHTISGYVAVKDMNGNRFSVHKSDPRLKTGEVVGVIKNTRRYIDKTTNKIVCLEPTDPRILDENYIPYDYSKSKLDLTTRPEVDKIKQRAKILNIKLPKRWMLRKDLTEIYDILERV